MYLFIYLCNFVGLCGDYRVVSVLSDPDFGAEGGDNAPIRWMPSAVKCIEKDEEDERPAAKDALAEPTQ